MTQPTLPTLRDLRQDRTGRYIYIPLALRFGAFVVPAEQAASLDRAASRFAAISIFVMCLLIGIVAGSLAREFGVLGLGMVVFAVGRQRLASGLEPAALASDSLVPRSFSWARVAARMGKFQLRITLTACVVGALFPLPLLATESPLSRLWLGALAWSVLFGFFAYASWRGLKSLP
jgi:hypothetical protein